MFIRVSNDISLLQTFYRVVSIYKYNRITMVLHNTLCKHCIQWNNKKKSHTTNTITGKNNQPTTIKPVEINKSYYSIEDIRLHTVP